MAYNRASAFIAKLMDITTKVERMRDDVVRLTNEVSVLRARIEQLEAARAGDVEAEKVATLRQKNQAMPDPVRVEHQRIEANMNKPARNVKTSKASAKRGRARQAAATASSAD